MVAVRFIPMGTMVAVVSTVLKLVAFDGLAVAVACDDVIPAVVFGTSVRQEEAEEQGGAGGCCDCCFFHGCCFWDGLLVQ